MLQSMLKLIFWAVFYVLIMAMPVLGQPTVAKIDTFSSALIGTIYSYTAYTESHDLSRNSATGLVDYNNITLGLRNNDYGCRFVYRGEMSFYLDISCDSSLVDSIVVILDGSNISIAGTGAAFTLILAEGLFLNTKTLLKSDFHRFYDYASSGAYTALKGLSNQWSSASYSSNWNRFKFTSYGRGRALLKNKDYFRITAITSKDSSAVGINISGSEYVEFSAAKILVYQSYIAYNVYAPDSLVFSTLTDSTAKLDSIDCNNLDISTKNRFALYDTTKGMYLDTAQTAPFKKAKVTYTKNDWKGKTFPFTRNYETKIIMQAFAPNGRDSSEIAVYARTFGTPTGSDTVTVHDTTEVYYYVHDTITIVIDTMFVLQSAAVYDLISDSIGLARLEWRSDISESLATVQPESLAYANLTGLDSAEFYVMGYDSTTGGTVLRKLKELLSYIGL